MDNLAIASAIASLVAIYLLTGKNLRPRILLDHYNIFYLTFASLVALHVQLFAAKQIGISFFILFLVSTVLFTASYSLSSAHFSSKIARSLKYYREHEAFTKERITHIINSLKSPFLLLIILSTSFELVNTFSQIVDGSAAYVTKVEENLNNPLSRYLIYAAFLTSSLSLYFPSLLIFANIKGVKLFLRTLLGTVLLASYASVLTLGSRGSLAAVLFPLGLYIILFPKQSKLSQSLNRIQAILVPLIIAFAAIVTAIAFKIDDYASSYGDLSTLLFQRILSNADVATVFHGAGLQISDFNDYDGFYYFFPFFKLFGVELGSTSLGIRIGELAGQPFGKGPVPTYFYESLILFKNDLGVYLTSVLFGFAASLFRFLSINYLVKGMSKPVFLPLSFAFYIYSPVGDWNLFIIGFLVAIVFALILGVILRLRFAPAASS
jgi:hypothetical protein